VVKAWSAKPKKQPSMPLILASLNSIMEKGLPLWEDYVTIHSPLPTKASNPAPNTSVLTVELTVSNAPADLRSKFKPPSSLKQTFSKKPDTIKSIEK
jgi:hypothetical protein